MTKNGHFRAFRSRLLTRSDIHPICNSFAAVRGETAQYLLPEVHRHLRTDRLHSDQPIVAPCDRSEALLCLSFSRLEPGKRPSTDRGDDPGA